MSEKPLIPGAPWNKERKEAERAPDKKGQRYENYLPNLEDVPRSSVFGKGRKR